MRSATATLVVFLGGFAIMVLEIIGARYLAKDFGGSFYVWISQIGVILIALALGYYVGGTLADHFKKAAFLAFLLVPAGIITFLIPNFASILIDAIIMRHPLNQDIPPVWQKLDPAIGSAFIFLLPCFVLATLSPYMIRLSARHLAQVGRTSGLIYASSTVGSIAGVFVSGYILIDQMSLTSIFRATGGLTVLLGLICPFMDRWLLDPGAPERSAHGEPAGPAAAEQDRT
ncbi:MAG: fused MFS/spermidine synthase [Candidatus Omnitrophica bacterium]|nr:fused MFS/spermidine synthase [Candidatus Omnitrophota bacterium]